MKRIVSNIQNLGFTIMNETVEGSKQKPAGIVLDQTLVNGESQGVSVRLINGKQRSGSTQRGAVEGRRINRTRLMGLSLASNNQPHYFLTNNFIIGDENK